MGRILEDIKAKTSAMDRKEAFSYILTYYWYHILGIVLAAALILLFTGHYLFGNQKPIFTCVMVNQRMDDDRDQRIAKSFADAAGLPEKQVVVDSNYHFSYDQTILEGVNESSYEKFFFQWGNKELDAVILSEGFYRHCKSMGGEFRQLTEKETEGFAEYMDGGTCTAVILGRDRFLEQVNGKKDEKLLLAFPTTGKHEKESGQFLKFLRESQENRTGGIGLEEIIN